MKKILLLVTALSFHVDAIFAQQMEWLKSNPVKYTINPNLPRHFISASGNLVYTVRTDTNTVNFGTDIFGEQIIDCYTSAGILKWSFPFGDSVNVADITTDRTGKLLVGGRFMEIMHLGSVDSLTNTGVAFNENNFLFCIDSTGTLLWKKNISIVYPSFTVLSTVSTDHNGNFWFALQDFLTSLIAKFDNSGQPILTYTVAGTRILSSISFDQHDNLFLAGSAENGTFSIGSFTDTIPDTYMMFVARINSSGTPSWVRFAHDVTFQGPVVAATLDGNVFLGGNLLDSTTWGNIQFYHPQWVYGMFLTRVDSLGNFYWGAEAALSPTIQGDFQPGLNKFLDTDDAGNVYLSGITRGTVSWGNNVISGGGPTLYNRTSILSFDYNGQARWSINGGCSGANTAFNVCASSPGNLYFACSAQDTTFFDSLTTNSGNYNVSVFGKVRLSIPTDISDRSSAENLFVYPNPTSAFVNIHFSGKPFNSLMIYNSLGQAVWERKYFTEDRAQLNIESLSPGIYTLSVLSGSRFLTTRFIKAD